MRFLRRLVVPAALALALMGAAALVAPDLARADELTPELETLELRQKAQLEAKKLASDLAPNDRRRLVGLYVAFDGNAADPSAMAACDDDGDYVVVLTDAMLRLVSVVARAQSYDEANGGHTIEDYASFLAASQVPGRRLLPPPPGFYASPEPGTTREDRLREALSFVIARELTHFRAGDLVCAHPTATHENGDDVWTASEQRRALETAAALYPGRATPRDEEAITRVLESGRTEQGALGLLGFLAQLEAERSARTARFVPTYVVQHPASSARASAVKMASTNHHDE